MMEMKFVLCMLHSVTVVSRHSQQNCIRHLPSDTQRSNIITVQVINNKQFVIMYLPEYNLSTLTHSHTNFLAN
jgi:hypothetical protein